MTATPLDPRTAQMQRSARDTQDGARKIEALKKTLMPSKDKEKKLREACEGFESIFIQKMWEQMRATVPKSGLMQGREEQFWQGMFDQELSKKMSSAGGIGLADMMYDQLSRSLVSATRTTASDMTRKGEGFTVTAAPLLGQDSPTGVQATAAARAVNRAPSAPAPLGDIYSGEATQPEAATASAVPVASTTVAVGMRVPAAASSAGTATTPESGSSTSPIVEQFLAELRARQLTEPQAPPPAAPTEGTARGTGAPAAPHQQPGAPTVGADPVAQARNVLQAAGSRMPAGGVLPPMPPMQRQPGAGRYQASPVIARTAGDASTSTPAVMTPPTAGAPNAVPGVSPAGTSPSAPQAGTVAAASPGAQEVAPENAAPRIVHRTFTTNVPPTRSGRRRPPRVPKGQALNRMPTPTGTAPIPQAGPVQQTPQAADSARQPATAASTTAAVGTNDGDTAAQS